MHCRVEVFTVVKSIVQFKYVFLFVLFFTLRYTVSCY